MAQHSCTCGHERTRHERRHGGSGCESCTCAGYRAGRIPAALVRSLFTSVGRSARIDAEYEQLCANYPG